MPSASTRPTDPVTATALVGTYLDAFFSRKIVAASDIHPRYETLWREITRVSGYGKRLRPLMVVMAYEAFGGSETSSVIPAAAACELLHVSMLVHDDIIDRDLVRHGQPTIQSAYETRYASEVTNDPDRAHNALGAALLAGDLLLSEARGIITKLELPEDRIRQAGYVFDQAVFDVAGGELLDVESSAAKRGSVDALTVITHKTANYSFINPLLIGAILAGASHEIQKSLRTFALNLGIAYQLTDDILGVFGDTSATGKSNDGDIREGKATFMVERFYGRADAATVHEFEALYGNPFITESQSARVRDLLRETGALRETERSIKAHVDRATRSLAELNLSPSQLTPFNNLVLRCTDRTQ